MKRAKLLQGSSKSCEICDLHFPNLASLNAHLSEHFDEEQAASQPLDSDDKTHSDKTPMTKPTDTAYCDPHDSFIIPLDVLDQQWEDTPSSATPKTFTCNVCNAVFQQIAFCKNHLRFHMRDYNPEVRLKAKSQIDEIESSTMHRNTIDIDCLICGKSLRNRSSYMSHIKVHTKAQDILVRSRAEMLLGELQEDTMHKCGLCGKTFLFLSALQAHLVVHDNEQPFTCDVCSAEFKTLRSLKSHADTHAKLLKCKQCDKIFSHAASLKEHARLHRAKMK